MNTIIKHRTELTQLFNGCIKFNVSLSEITRWKIGGKANAIASPRSLHEIIALYKWSIKHKIPTIIVGETSNLLFSDMGFDGLIIQIGSSYSNITLKGNTIVAQSGAWVPYLARLAMKSSLTGVEHIVGIPGTIGGLLYMNGGSQRKCIGDNVFYVLTVDKLGCIHKYTKEQCEFSYRKSIFQSKDEVIVEVALKLNNSTTNNIIRKEMLDVLSSRRHKFPQKKPSCGSVFISDPNMYEKIGPPGKIIESLGLKGKSIGQCQISNIHANFIVNNGGGKAADILDLISVINKASFKRYNQILISEALYVSETGDVVPLHMAAKYRN